MKKNIIRVGDTIKIETPLFFDRCGYPSTISDTEDSIDDYEDALIRKLLDVGENAELSYWQEKAYRMIRRGLALNILATRKFGGAFKTLHLSELPYLKDHEAKVTDIKTVITGTYVPCSGSGEDYEPAYLKDRKYHRILTLNLTSWGQPMKIPAANVAKVYA